MCFNERPWDAATVSGALAEVGQLVIYALVSDGTSAVVNVSWLR